MKRIFAILSLLVTLTLFTSCELKHDDDINWDQVWLSDIYGKWDLWSTESLSYSSIEFSTEGYYFIRTLKTVSTADQGVLYGKYSKTDDYEITLEGLGVIEITDYDDDKLWYTITLDGESESETHKATAAEDRDEEISDNTSDICSIWAVYSYYYEAYSKQYTRDTDVAYIYLSTDGTFISIDKNGDAYSYKWAWSDTNETSITTSNGNSYKNWTLEGVNNFDVVNLSSGYVTLEFSASIEIDISEEENDSDKTSEVVSVPFTMRFESTKKIEF